MIMLPYLRSVSTCFRAVILALCTPTLILTPLSIRHLCAICFLKIEIIRGHYRNVLYIDSFLSFHSRSIINLKGSLKSCTTLCIFTDCHLVRQPMFVYARVKLQWRIVHYPVNSDFLLSCTIFSSTQASPQLRTRAVHGAPKYSE